MQISHLLQGISGSATAQIFAHAKELEAQGRDIVHLEIGQPEFQPPQVIIDATKLALDQGKTSYTVSRGTSSLRHAIANFHNAQDKVDLGLNDVIVTTGAKLAIFSSVWSVTNPGDNVIILNPSWVSYADIVSSLGAEPRFVSVDLDFSFDESYLRSQIDERTKAMIINSPSNPTGAIISPAQLQKLFDICAEHDILIVSDEIYNEYVYRGTHTSLLHINGWDEYGVVVNGFSKTFSMTGFRLGYALASPQIINQINKVVQLTSSCPVNFVQDAAIVALDNIASMRTIIQEITSNRLEIVDEAISDLPVTYTRPDGAIYAWIGIESNDSVSWSQKLLEQAGVAVTPGRAFGPAGEGYVRLCFATSEESVQTGIQRLGKFLSS